MESILVQRLRAFAATVNAQIDNLISRTRALEAQAERLPVSITVSATAPASPSVNDLWVDTGN